MTSLDVINGRLIHTLPREYKRLEVIVWNSGLSWFNESCFGHLELRIGKLGSHSSKSLHCSCAQMPNPRLPVTNCQRNLFWFCCMYISKRYWVRILSISFLLTLIQSRNQTSLSLCSFMLHFARNRSRIDSCLTHLGYCINVEKES